MKFTIDNKDTGTLEVRVGNFKEKTKFSGMDLDKVYQWYPMNIYYKLRYQAPKDRLYLFPTDNPPLNVDYDYEERSRTKPDGVQIKEIGPEMVCMNVMLDNIELSREASKLGIPNMVVGDYTTTQIKEGIEDLLALLDTYKESLEYRIEKEGKLEEFRKKALQEQDSMLYSYSTEEEQESMKQLGKMYTMLNLMRKIAEVREK